MTQSKKAILIFPHQLFLSHPAFEIFTEAEKPLVYIIEDFLFFRQYNFHAHKLVLHRASMKGYADKLIKKGFSVRYLDSKTIPTISSAYDILAKDGVGEVHVAHVTDDWLFKSLTASAKKHGYGIVWYETPAFLNTQKECITWATGHPKLLMHHFYVAQRKKLNILVEKNEVGGFEPVGGIWSFDADNRKKLPKNIVVPPIDYGSITYGKESYRTEAIGYVKNNFPNAYGNPAAFSYAVSHEGAERALDQFIKKRLEQFGPYEDSISKNESGFFHSVLSPYINIGLLTPAHVVSRVLGQSKHIPMASLEGFIRQIIGWREFMRLVYETHGREMRLKNFWNHTKPLPAEYWTGHTGVEPVDTTIKKVLNTAYSHHIERLMIMGNWMLLSEYHPDDVYKWFMEMYIDSYDWVMVPNVYGMSQFADGGIFATKPYVSGSNYILKMSDYKKGDWSTLWDTKFWNFLFKHEAFFSKNPRMSMLIKSRRNK
jgi:deoxyribodipyrimidine photolyase-related protein